MEYATHEERFNLLLGKCQSLFSDDDLSEVRHYLEHGEIELAIEGFCLELFKKDAILPTSLGQELKSLMQNLGMDKDSVLDAELWQKLQDFLSRPK